MNQISVANLNDLLIKQYCQNFPKIAFKEKTEMSVEDKRFMSIMEKTVELRNYYYLPLPFKEDEVVLPNNYQQVQQRIISLKVLVKRNEQYHKKYTSFLERMIKKGYAATVH